MNPAGGAAARSALVIGGGPIGLLCAMLLARRRIACCVLDARPLPAAQRDGRLLALSRGTWELLAPLLDPLPPRAPIREVHVSSRGDFGATVLSAADFDGADLGATVPYGDLLAALEAAVVSMPGVTVLRPAAAAEIRQRPDRVDVLLDDGTLRSADFAVHAEGSVAARGAERDDAPWALLADLRMQPSRAAPSGTAYERFTAEGPLALLPTPRCAAGGSGAGLSLVWCMSEAQAQRRMNLPGAQLIDEVNAQIGPRIGRVTAVVVHGAARLPQQQRASLQEHRLVAVGNAAQTMHPVAGQGFNLGARDCATLADEIAAGGPVVEALARHARRRGPDRAAIVALTRVLPELFASGFAPLAAARGLGLALLDALPPLRRQFAQLLIFGVRS